ncbi:MULTISPECIES: DUF6653 family protein [Streptomyces]|uniref:DUF6653 family protein n=1 Tax=Streptomyces lycopersici TaxID=2974589 RepID=UPI00293E4547|nr:DUF6653 family protein [Streptomyces sp. NEAU-383]
MRATDERVVERFAKAFRMSDEIWRRHANPWSVWTRFAALPALVVAVWSRDWIGWWSLVPVSLVVVWLWVNVRIFRPVEPPPRQWTAKGIYGERIWLHERPRVPAWHLRTLRLLALLGPIGGGFLVWGVVSLDLWLTVLGCTVVVLAQLWRIDHFGWIYDLATLAADNTAEERAVQ